jgi:hypothetical protein
MFFFGLLSTNLPYILLGMVYLVTFASFSLKALEQQAIDQSEEQAKHIYLEINEITGNNTQCFHYFDWISQQAIELDTKVLNKPTPPLLKVRLQLDPLNFLTQFIPHFLFSRPPPAQF